MAKGEFTVQGIFSARAHIPLVDIQFEEARIQISPEKAREIGEMLFRVAEAAETDSFLFHWVTGPLGQDGNAASQIIADFRSYQEREQMLQVTVDFIEEEKDGQEPS